MVDALLSHDWPGNVRELQRVIESVICVARGERAELSDLPPALRGDAETVLWPSLKRGDTLREWASRYVRLVWQRHAQNKRQACVSLGISYHTLQSHLRYGNRMLWAREPRSAPPAPQRAGGVRRGGTLGAAAGAGRAAGVNSQTSRRW